MIGISIYPADGDDDVDVPVHQANLAMYHAKALTPERRINWLIIMTFLVL